MGKHNDKGQEVLSKQKVALPLRYQQPLSMREMVQRYVRTELSRQAEAEGNETWEESDDFAVGDDPEVLSQYQLDDEQDRRQVSMFIEEQPVGQPAKPAEKNITPPKAEVPEGSPAHGEE